MKETLKTTNQGEDGRVFHKEVEGERIMINDVPCFIYFEKKDWTVEFIVTHLETGTKVSKGRGRTGAIMLAEANIKKNPAAILQMKNTLINKGVKMPVNV